ncbi:type IV pilin protein [Oscillibacter sp.]|uniref:type IV pilin protein n=1 Tax=Oscillibacter sp. TaxID=1945593 RepID=UPI002DBF95C8|nr:prepilin-type N-terminal cleavage/methylation domain-containing protein [Oscillibacter sp.]
MISTLKKKLSKKGFTLAELLIVVAIIAVLVAIAIPVFTSQLERSREATDAANIRNAYAEIMVDILEDPQGAITHADINLQQRQDGWQNADTLTNLNALAKAATADLSDLVVTVDLDDVDASAPVTFTYTAGSSTTSPTLAIAQ